MLVEDNKKNN